MNNEPHWSEDSPLMSLSKKQQALAAGLVAGVPLGSWTLWEIAMMQGWLVVPELVGLAGLIGGGIYMAKHPQFHPNWGALVGAEQEYQPALSGEQEEDIDAEYDYDDDDDPLLPTTGPLQFPTDRQVDLGDCLQLDINDLVGKTVLVCGIRGTGKTTLGCKLVEELGRFHLPMFILDIKRDYVSIADILPRCRVLGKKDVTKEKASRIAKMIFEENYQVILDLASFGADFDKGCEIASSIVDALFEWVEEHPRDRRPCELVIDECQSFFPQNGASSIKDGDIYNRMLIAYRRAVAQGRSSGINPIILTQRIAQTSKEIIGQPELLFLFKQTMDNDVKRYAEFTNVPADQIRGFRKGQGIFVDYEGDSHIVQFHNRKSDGSMSSSPRASMVLKPLSKPVTRENYAYASETHLLSEDEYEDKNIYRTEANRSRQERTEVLRSTSNQGPHFQARSRDAEVLRSTSECTDTENVASNQLPSTSDAEVVRMLVKRFKAGEKAYSICKSLGLPTSGQSLMDVSSMLKDLSEQEED